MSIKNSNTETNKAYLAMLALPIELWNKWAISRANQNEVEAALMKGGRYIKFLIQDFDAEKLSPDEENKILKEVNASIGGHIEHIDDIPTSAYLVLKHSASLDISNRIFPGPLTIELTGNNRISLLNSAFLGNTTVIKNTDKLRIRISHCFFYETLLIDAEKANDPAFSFRCSHTIIRENVEFYKFRTKYSFTFSRTTVFENSFMTESEFQGRSRFLFSNFYGKVQFDRSHFDQEAIFKECEFGDSDLRYTDSTLTQSSFASVTVIGKLSFLDTKFFHTPSFVNLQASNKIIFQRCSFSSPPDFSGASTPADLAFDESLFLTRKKISVDELLQDIRSFRKIKDILKSLNSMSETLTFFGMQMKAERAAILKSKSLRGAPFLVFSWLFEVTSDYGKSISRPIATLLLSIFAFAALYSLPGWGESAFSFYEAMQASISQAFPFTSLSKASFPANYNVGLCIQITSAFQNVISGMLLFLFGLGVKNNLSIK